MTTHFVKETRCPACRHKLDAATNAQRGTSAAPKDGDITVCIQCGTALQFASDAALRVLSSAELERLPADTRREVRRVKQLINGMRPS
jgi:RNase P subunit RPR2